MSMNVLPACIHIYHVCALCPRRSEEGIGGPEIGVTDSCEPPGGSWDLNPCSLH